MMSRPWEAERMRAVPFSGIRKMMERAEELEREGKPVSHLEIGRPDFDTPPHIKEAAARALEKGRSIIRRTTGFPNSGAPSPESFWSITSSNTTLSMRS